MGFAWGRGKDSVVEMKKTLGLTQHLKQPGKMKKGLTDTQKASVPVNEIGDVLKKK